MIQTKRIAIFISALLFFMCLFNVPSHADISSSYTSCCIIGRLSDDNVTHLYGVLCTNGSCPITISNGDFRTNATVYYRNYFNLNDAINATTNATNLVNGYCSGHFEYFINIRGTGFSLTGDYTSNQYFDSLEDYLNPPEPEHSWWYDMWHDLGEQMGTPEFWFGEWFVALIDGIFGNDDDNTITENVTIGIPSLAPTPTPIPYQTVVVPQVDPVTGDTYYTYEYHYNNLSGTPIVATAPPLQPTSSAGGGNGGGDYAPINGDPYAMPNLPWLNTTVTIGDDNVYIFDGFGSGLDSIDSVGSEYTEGMNVATNAFGFLPSSWIILIGIGAAIILIGGIISRFLS